MPRPKPVMNPIVPNRVVNAYKCALVLVFMAIVPFNDCLVHQIQSNVYNSRAGRHECVAEPLFT